MTTIKGWHYHLCRKQFRLTAFGWAVLSVVAANLGVMAVVMLGVLP